MASMRLMRAFAPAMAERGWGRIVNVTSSAGKRPSLTNAAYSVTKAAQSSLSRVFADTYGPQGVLVNSVAPGPVASSLWMDEGGLADQTAEARGLSREESIEVQEGKMHARALRHRGGDRERRGLPLLRARGRRHRRRLVGRRRHGCNHRLKRRQSALDATRSPRRRHAHLPDVRRAEAARRRPDPAARRADGADRRHARRARRRHGACVGPPDSIIIGSTKVMIRGKPAARMGDSTAHGGVIVVGFPKVMIN